MMCVEVVMCVEVAMWCIPSPLLFNCHIKYLNIKETRIIK